MAGVVDFSSLFRFFVLAPHCLDVATLWVNPNTALKTESTCSVPVNGDKTESKRENTLNYSPRIVCSHKQPTVINLAGPKG